jgi:hypothetical protein
MMFDARCDGMGCLRNGVVHGEALQPPNFCQQPLCQATAIGLNELNIMAEKRARCQQLNSHPMVSCWWSCRPLLKNTIAYTWFI